MTGRRHLTVTRVPDAGLCPQVRVAIGQVTLTQRPGDSGRPAWPHSTLDGCSQ